MSEKRVMHDAETEAASVTSAEKPKCTSHTKVVHHPLCVIQLHELGYQKKTITTGAVR